MIFFAFLHVEKKANIGTKRPKCLLLLLIFFFLQPLGEIPHLKASQ